MRASGFQLFFHSTQISSPTWGGRLRRKLMRTLTCIVSRGVQSMKLIIDDNRYQSISINRFISIIDDQSMKRICIVGPYIDCRVLWIGLCMCGLLATLKRSQHYENFAICGNICRIFVSLFSRIFANQFEKRLKCFLIFPLGADFLRVTMVSTRVLI